MKEFWIEISPAHRFRRRRRWGRRRGEEGERSWRREGRGREEARWERPSRVLDDCRRDSRVFSSPREGVLSAATSMVL